MNAESVCENAVAFGVIPSWLALARAPECGVCSEKSELRKCGEAALSDQARNLGLARPDQDPRQRRASFAEFILSAAEGLRVTENRSFSHTF